MDKFALQCGLAKLRYGHMLARPEATATLEYIDGMERLLEGVWDKLSSERALNRSDLVTDIELALGADWVPKATHR